MSREDYFDDDDDYSRSSDAPSQTGSNQIYYDDSSSDDDPYTVDPSKIKKLAATNSSSTASGNGSYTPSSSLGRGRGRGQLTSGTPRDGPRYTQDMLNDLDRALADGRAADAESLLSKDIPVNTPMSSGWSPLMVAAFSGYPASVSLVLRYKPNLNYDCGKQTALLAACYSHSHLELGVRHIVGLLLDAGAKPNVRDSEGMTPLMRAAEKGRLGVCRMLLEKGAMVSCGDNQSNTALMHAAMKGHLACVRVLLMAGADVCRTNKHDLNAVAHASANDFEKVVTYLEKVEAEQKAKEEDQAYQELEDGSTKKAIGQLEMFLMGIQQRPLLKTFVDHNVAFEQLGNMNVDDLAKMGVVSADSRQCVIEAARRLAIAPDGSVAQGKTTYHHQLCLDTVVRTLKFVITHVKLQSDVVAFLLREAKNEPFRIELVRPDELDSFIAKCHQQRSVSQDILANAHNLMQCTEELLDADEDHDDGGSGGWLRTAAASTACLSVAVAVVAAFSLSKGKLTLW